MRVRNLLWFLTANVAFFTTIHGIINEWRWGWFAWPGAAMAVAVFCTLQASRGWGEK